MKLEGRQRTAELVVTEMESCPDCGTLPSNIHLDGCDVERCSVCGGQYLMCGCDEHDKAFARWTGFWPGLLEAQALGVSMNDLYPMGIERALFIKPLINP